MKVGPTQTIKSVREVSLIAKDGDVIEIDAATYRGDVAVFAQKNIILRGVGGRPILDAYGASAEGKGILVLRGDNITVENLEFANARVADKNGAGIRHETGKLVVRNAVFRDNEMGILTGNTETQSLEIYGSQFLRNGYGDGYSHNLYVGRIGRLTVQGSYFTSANIGHLLKSRARENFILYNRLTDESAGTASYELDLPDGGLAYVIGNLIVQGPNSPNRTIVSYAAESRYWPVNEIYLSHNTIANERTAGCTFVRTPAGTTASLVNNIFVGTGCDRQIAGTLARDESFTADPSEFANASGYDYRLRTGSRLQGAAGPAGSGGSYSITPTAEYVHPASTRSLLSAPNSPGAFQSTY